MSKAELKRTYDVVKIFGVDALFFPNGITKKNTPKGLFAYDLRSFKNSSIVKTIETRPVIIDYAGTILVGSKIPMTKDYILVKGNVLFTGKEIPVSDFIEQSKKGE